VFGSFEELRTEFRPVMRLAVPLVLAEIGWMFMGVVDTLMVGRLPESAVAIGAVSLGTAFYYGITVFAGGLMLGLDTMVAQAYGGKRYADCHRSLWTALFFLVPLVPAVMLAVWLAANSFLTFGVNPSVQPAATRYTATLNFGAPGLFLYFVMRRYLQGIGRVRIVTFALLSANVINFVGNWALIYGRLGCPALGTSGSAWATVIARYYMAGVLIAYTLYIEHRHKHGIFDVGIRPDLARLGRLLALGGPAALHIGFEIAIFTVATLLAARLTPEDLAAHQIALNLASLTFMVPLGLSAAAAVRVGHRIGANDPAGAGRSGYVTILLGAAFMSTAAIMFIAAPRWLARMYTTDPGVVATSVSLLAVAAVFQLFDGVQIVSAGALRGAGDTRTPMLANFFFYWVVGMPCSYYLCFRLGYGIVGHWSGLCLALVLIGCTLLMVWRREVHALNRRQTLAAT
jgi:MATE family multidrug resistance protein